MRGCNSTDWLTVRRDEGWESGTVLVGRRLESLWWRSRKDEEQVRIPVDG